MVNVKNLTKWVAPVLMFVFCDFIYRQHLVKYLLDRDYLVVNFFENSFLNKTFSFGLLNFAVAVIILLISKFIFKEKLTSIDSSDKISFKKSAIIVFLAVVVTIIIFYLLTYIIYDVLGSSVNSAAAIYIRDMYMRNKFIYVIFTFFTVTFEEVVYRKLLFGYLYDLHSGCNRYIRLITSLLGSVIIFGAIHDGVLSSGMIFYVVAGISFTIVYFYTKRISAAIAIHFLYNICVRLIRTII
ncbi:CPBP family intramembrane glutamic endopeptidase [Parvimonas micra]